MATTQAQSQSEAFPNTTELLTLDYVSLDDAVLLDGNPKQHDLQLIAESIKANGFVDPPKWDGTLNGGEGGLVFGNGRTEALAWMKAQGWDLPRGIGLTKDGNWAIPVIFGVDAQSEAAAKRLCIDHNNLTLAGGSFTALDMSRMYDQQAYLLMLGSLAEEGDMPLTVDDDDLSLLVKLYGSDDELKFQAPDDDEYEDMEDEEDAPAEDEPPPSSVRMVQLFLNTETFPEFMTMVECLNEVYKTNNPTDCVMEAMRELYAAHKPED